MATSIELAGGKLSKTDRRIAKKYRKATALLQRETDLKLLEEPAKNIVVSNGGLSNNVSSEDIFQIFKEFGVIEKIVSPSLKPYCCLVYEEVESAIKAKDSVNATTAHLRQDEMVVTLYVNFLSEVPAIFCEKKWGLPPGALLLEDAVTKDEEELFLQSLNWSETVDVGNCLKNRLVQHFGYAFNYDTNNIDKTASLDDDIPDVFLPVLQRLVDNDYLNVLPDQLTVNQYIPGHGIPQHIDTHSAFEDGLLSISLGSSIVMEFRSTEGGHYHALLPPRSALNLCGESRYAWSHGITPRKNDLIQTSSKLACNQGLTLMKRGIRTSLTFRKVRQGHCTCNYRKHCDSQGSAQKNSPLATEAEKLEEQHVHAVYERIANHFSDTRHSPWPRVREFIAQQPGGSIVLDVGCGNGKYLSCNPSAYLVGCDRSAALSSIAAANNNRPTFVCDALKVPVCDSMADAVISIAVIHHFSTEERRVEALAELARLLRPGGRGLVYVWAFEQKRGIEKSKYVTKSSKPTVPNSGSSVANVTADCGRRENVDQVAAEAVKLAVHVNRTEFEAQDLLVPWHLRGKEDISAPELHHRYYHVFKEGELQGLVDKVPLIETVEIYYDQGNWCLIFEKR